jgi:hypothetical protein
MEELKVDRDRFLLLRNADETYTFNFNLPTDRKQLDSALAECRENEMSVLAVFIDSIRGITPFDDNESKIKNVMMPLNAIVCDKYGAGLAYLDHHKKGLASTLLDKVSGTPAKAAACRVVYAITTAGAYVRKIELAKTNILDHRPPLLKSVFSKTHGLIIYEVPEADPSAKDAAQRFLIDLFSEQTRYTTGEITELGEQQGLGYETLKKAKAELGIESKNEGIGQPWLWICDKFSKCL